MSSERAGDVEPTDARVLGAMLALSEPSSVASIAGEASSWNRQDEVAVVVGDLVARGLVEHSTTAGWHLTVTGERVARRARGPFGPHG